jgi:copper chaperone
MCNSHQSHDTAAHAHSAASDLGSEPSAHAYSVQGMTCEHCATSVTEEVEQVQGVTGVDVDLQTGRLSVRGDGFSDEAIRVAVDEAGYEVVSR